MKSLIMTVVFIVTIIFLANRSLQKLKKKAHRSAAMIKYIMPMVRAESDHRALDLNKLMTTLFLIDLDSYKRTGSALINATWQWKNDNPISMMVISLLQEMDKKELKINYQLKPEEILAIDEVYLKVKDLSKIEVDAMMFTDYPKLKEVKEDQLVFPNKVVA